MQNDECRTKREKVLQRRFRFLLPIPLAVLFMLSLAFMGADFQATRQVGGIAWVAIFEAGLAINIAFRVRTGRELHSIQKRRSSGQCTVCGYDIRHSPDRCPECGQTN